MAYSGENDVGFDKELDGDVEYIKTIGEEMIDKSRFKQGSEGKVDNLKKERTYVVELKNIVHQLEVEVKEEGFFLKNKEDFMLVETEGDGGFNEEMDGDAENIDVVNDNDQVILFMEKDKVVVKRKQEENELEKGKLVKEKDESIDNDYEEELIEEEKELTEEEKDYGSQDTEKGQYTLIIVTLFAIFNQQLRAFLSGGLRKKGIFGSRILRAWWYYFGVVLDKMEE